MAQCDGEVSKGMGTTTSKANSKGNNRMSRARKVVDNNEAVARAEQTQVGKVSQGIEQMILEKISQEGKDISVSLLVDQVSDQSGYSRDRILSRLLRLKEEKKIFLAEPIEYTSFHSFAMSPDSLWFWAALTATLLSLALISVTAGFGLYLRYAFGGLLILFLPGFALIQMLYARKKELDDLTRVALSIGLSLALVPLDGLVLNYTPFGIRLIPVALSIAGMTIVFLLLALRRKHAYYKLAHGIG